MKKMLLLAAIGLIAAPAIADFQLGQVAGTKSLSYNLATGEMSATPSARIGSPIWATNVSTGYFFVIRDHSAAYPDDTYLNLDWGDIADGTEVGGFWFAYIGTGSGAGGPDTGTQIILFFGEENGFNSYMRTGLAGYIVTGLPDLPPATPSGYYGWLITVDLEPNSTFTITGSDLDGDTLTDWGWAQWVPYNDWVNPFMGPLIQAPSTTPGMVGTGSENVFDIYIAVSATDHNTFTYDGSYWFGGTPWAAFSMILYDTNGGPSPCPQPGCEADLNGDCVVELADLAALLGNYGATSGITHDGGDIEPVGGDGDVDLADLAVLLGQYGDDCN